MLCLWTDNNAAEKKVKTFFLRMPEPGAARLAPHCQIVRPEFFGRYQSLPISAAPAFIVTLRSSETLQNLPPFKYFRNAAGFFKLQPCLLRRRRRRLPRLSLLSKSGCCACVRGRMAQQFAGGAGNEASCSFMRLHGGITAMIAPGGAVFSHHNRFSPQQTWAFASCLMSSKANLLFVCSPN